MRDVDIKQGKTKEEIKGQQKKPISDQYTLQKMAIETLSDSNSRLPDLSE
jgi:hypothetical protein